MLQWNLKKKEKKLIFEFSRHNWDKEKWSRGALIDTSLKIYDLNTLFENHIKKSHFSTLRAKRAILQDKKLMKMPKWLILASLKSRTVLPDSSIFHRTKIDGKYQKWSVWLFFWESKVCGQTVLPDRSIFHLTKNNGKCQKWSLARFLKI